MASRFEDMIGGTTTQFLSLYGVNVTVNNGDGARNIKAIINTNLDVNIKEANTELQYRSKVIEISARDNSEGVVEPKVRGDVNGSGGMTVLLPGDAATWYVKDIQNTDAGMHTLEIVNNAGV